MGSDAVGVQGSGSLHLGAVWVGIWGALAGSDVVVAQFSRSAVSISHASSTSTEQCEDRKKLLSGTKVPLRFGPQTHEPKVQEAV